MEFSEIIFLIVGSLCFLIGFAITIYPNEIGKWLKNHSIHSDKSFYFAGFVIGLIGLGMLLIILLG